MKKILLTAVASTSMLLSATLSTSEAVSHMGEQATVCGVVYGGHYAKSSKGQPTFINLDGAYPNQKFTIVIWGSDRHKFSSPERRYNDKRLCATGTIDSYRSTPQIVISNKSQLN